MGWRESERQNSPDFREETSSSLPSVFGTERERMGRREEPYYILIVQAPRDAETGAFLGNCSMAKDFREPAQFVTNTFINSSCIIQPPPVTGMVPSARHRALEKTLENKTWRNFLLDRGRGSRGKGGLTLVVCITSRNGK